MAITVTKPSFNLRGEVSLINIVKKIAPLAQLKIDSKSNFALSANKQLSWESSRTGIQFGDLATLNYHTNGSLQLTMNYQNYDGQNRAIAAGSSTRYYQSGGTHVFQTTPTSATAAGDLINTTLKSAFYIQADTKSILTDSQRSSPVASDQLSIVANTYNLLGLFRDLDYNSVGPMTARIQVGGYVGSTRTPAVYLDSTLNTATTGYFGISILNGASSITEKFRINSAGFMGVNLDTASSLSPLAKIHFEGTGQAGAPTVSGSKGATIFAIDNTNVSDYGGSIEFGGKSGQTFAAIKCGILDGNNNGVGYLSIYTRAVNTDAAMTERVRILQGGGVCFGRNTTVGVGSHITVESSGNGIHTNTPTNSSAIAFHIGGTQIGNIYVSGSTTTYNTGSDYRLKNITGPVTNSGIYIDSLNPVEGTWKVDGSAFVGLIAHEIQEISKTNVVTGEKDGEQMQSMDYSNSELIANMIAELKSLRARVAQLESR